MADYKVSPHTERIFKKNEQLLDEYKNKRLDYTKGRGTKSASCFHFHIDLHTIHYTLQRLRCQNEKKIKQLRYVQFAEYQPSPYTKRLIEKSETAIQSYKQKHSLI